MKNIYFEPNAAAHNMMQYIETIHPMKRMINSRGLDDAYAYVKQVLPSTHIHEYAPNEAADDWEVPPSWEVTKGFIKDKNGH